MNEPKVEQKRNGLFEAYVNKHAYRETASDRALMAAVRTIVVETVSPSQVRWAGSQVKGTGIEGSDLDMIVESREPVTEAQRRELPSALESRLRRPARALSHAVRLPAHEGAPKVDLAFANAAFGSRPLPDLTEYHNRRSRQAAARAIKLWTRAGNLPFIPGWAVEALVVHLDTPSRDLTPLALFTRVIEWLADKATPAAVEGVLRPAAFPRWNPAWSQRLPGQIEALRNHARALKRRGTASAWSTEADVDQWLRG